MSGLLPTAATPTKSCGALNSRPAARGLPALYAFPATSAAWISRPTLLPRKSSRRRELFSLSLEISIPPSRPAASRFGSRPSSTTCRNIRRRSCSRNCNTCRRSVLSATFPLSNSAWRKKNWSSRCLQPPHEAKPDKHLKGKRDSRREPLLPVFCVGCDAYLEQLKSVVHKKVIRIAVGNELGPAAQGLAKIRG